MTRHIAFLLFQDFQLLDLAGPLAAFETGGWAAGTPAYRLSLVSPDGGGVTSSAAVVVQTRPLEHAEDADTLIVVGGVGTEAAADDLRIGDFLRRSSSGVRRLCSVCTGAFLLASAGLLAGRRATTHWRAARLFETRHSDVRLEPDVIFIRDGNIWTSAGVTAGIDLALALVRDDLGEAAARRAAREIVVYLRRPGGQSQFSALIDTAPPDGRFAGLLAWARQNLNEPLSVDQLARRTAMSPRHFSRAFRAEVGTTPARTIERIRAEVALERVAHGRDAFPDIAADCGFGDADRMRRALIRIYGRTPQQVRREGRSPAASPDEQATPSTRRRSGRSTPRSGRPRSSGTGPQGR